MRIRGFLRIYFQTTCFTKNVSPVQMNLDYAMLAQDF